MTSNTDGRVVCMRRGGVRIGRGWWYGWQSLSGTFIINCPSKGSKAKDEENIYDERNRCSRSRQPSTSRSDMRCGSDTPRTWSWRGWWRGKCTHQPSTLQARCTTVVGWLREDEFIIWRLFYSETNSTSHNEKREDLQRCRFVALFYVKL